ncbi:hypothetical protein FG002_019260 [Chitinimonas sp. BJB300]|nr:hypothetical protein FG002_019260 [Chitinimonas sp. BJB300]
MPDPSAPRNKPVWSFKEASMTSRAAENAQKEASIRQLNLARQDRTFAYSPSPNGKFTRFDDMPVNWLELGKSSMGMVGSGLGVLAGDALLGTGGALMIAPEPVVTKLSGAALLVGGGALVARSATGFALNGANFYKALKGAPSGPDYLPGSALELAAKSMGGSDNIVRVAQASDMAIDVASGAAFRNVSIFNGAARYTASYPALLQQPRMMVSIEAAANAYSPVAWKLGTSTWGGYVGVGSAYTGVYDAGASAGWWGTPYVSVMEKK